MLERLGYTVLVAVSPNEAIRLAQEHAGEIGLLITDVVMPDMNGPDLASQLVSLLPGLKCLFMSGYTDDLIAPPRRARRRRALHPEALLVAQPFCQSPRPAHRRRLWPVGNMSLEAAVYYQTAVA